MKIKGVIAYAILLAFVVWCAMAFRADIAQIRFQPIWNARHAVLFAGTLSLFNYTLRIIRWRLYLKRLGFSLPLRFSALTYLAGFAFTLSPGKVGEMVRVKYYQKQGIPFSNIAAAFFVERLMDLLAMLALAFLALATSSAYNVLIWFTIGGIVTAMIVLTIAPWERIAAWVYELTWMPLVLRKPLQGIFRTLVSSKRLLHPRFLTIGFCLALLAWGSEGVGLMMIGAVAPGVVLDWSTATSIYAIAIIIGVLSFLPGGLGGTEAVMVALLHEHGFAMPDAILMTLVCRLLTLWLAVLIGWVAVFALREKNITPVINRFYMTENKNLLPLCVDLDGTLINSDLLLETFLLLIKRNPLNLFLIPLWLLRGKAALKDEITKRVALNPAALPYNQHFIDWLLEQKQGGRALWLCTASNDKLAQLVADHLGIFAGVLASNTQINLSGRKKANLLVEKFGAKQFDYCGNHSVDLAIWAVGHAAVVVNGSENFVKQAEAVAPIMAVFPRTGKTFLRAIFKAVRLHQWVKNVLVFVPLLAAHKFSDSTLMVQALEAFLAFGLCASSVYLLNDMLDLEVDRQHPRKRKRPFAAGDLSLLVGMALVPILLLFTILIASTLPKLFWLVIGGYYVMTVAYSFGLKSMVLIDTITLAGLYTIRIVAGAAAVGIPLSFWLLLFSIFLFFSLALVKRYAELDAIQRSGKLKAAGRGYHVEDLPILHSMGTAAGNMCVLVLALYINSPIVESLYHHPHAIWFLCVLLLYWISRIWLKTHRGKMHDDPIVFALKDSVSLIVGLMAVITVVVAL